MATSPPPSNPAPTPSLVVDALGQTSSPANPTPQVASSTPSEASSSTPTPPTPPTPPTHDEEALADLLEPVPASQQVTVTFGHVSVWVHPFFFQPGLVAKASMAIARKAKSIRIKRKKSEPPKGADLEAGRAQHPPTPSPTNPPNPFNPNAPPRQILYDVSGRVEPGQFLALLGPSGSGKTSLLSFLSGRTGRYARLEGGVLFNGNPLTKRTKRRIGYVMQDDLMFDSLTVYETLFYAAMLRLPREMNKEQKKERIERVIQALNLEKCRNTIVGGFFKRGISGGERKRLSIGHELLINPSIIMLDEPTSGLDSTTALRLMHTLRRLACGGRGIIATLHQPSSRMYQELDKLMLLSEGHVLYYGAAQMAIPWFQLHGYPLPFGVNPADFFLDLASADLGGIVSLATSDQVRWELVKRFEAFARARMGRMEQEIEDAMAEAAAVASQGEIVPVANGGGGGGMVGMKKQWNKLVLRRGRGGKARTQGTVTPGGGRTFPTSYLHDIDFDGYNGEPLTRDEMTTSEANEMAGRGATPPSSSSSSSSNPQNGSESRRSRFEDDVGSGAMMEPHATVLASVPSRQSLESSVMNAGGRYSQGMDGGDGGRDGAATTTRRLVPTIPTAIPMMDLTPASHVEDKKKQLPIRTLPPAPPSIASPEPSRWGATFPEQVRLLASRSFKTRRFESLGMQQFARLFFVTLVTGLFWLNKGGHGSPEQIRNTTGLLFFELLFSTFSAMFAALFTFPMEYRMLLKERASGMYRLSSYYLGRTIADLPLNCLYPSLFIIAIYWMGGLKATAAAFFFNWFSVIVVVMVAESWGLLIGATVTDLKTAQTLATIITLTFLLVAGFYTSNIAVWLDWLKYISFIYFGLALLTKIEFSDVQESAYSQFPVDPQQFPYEIFVLLGMLVVLRVVVYMVLRKRTSKT